MLDSFLGVFVFGKSFLVNSLLRVQGLGIFSAGSGSFMRLVAISDVFSACLGPLPTCRMGFGSCFRLLAVSDPIV